MLHNTETLDPKAATEQAITRESSIIKLQFDEFKPTWSEHFFKADFIEDHHYLTHSQILTDYYDFHFNRMLQPSAQNYYPEQIKFHGLCFCWLKDSTILSRNSYTVIDLATDIGGISSFLLEFFRVIISFYGPKLVHGLLVKNGYSFEADLSQYGSFCWTCGLSFCCCCDRKRQIKNEHLKAAYDDLRDTLDVL